MSKKLLNSVKIFSLDIFSDSISKLLTFFEKEIGACLKKGNEKKFFLTTPNPEFVIASKKDPSFLKTLQEANIAVPDGIGLVWAREVIKRRGCWRRFWHGLRLGLSVLKGGLADQVITGVDLMKALCQMAAKNGWSVYLLGGEPGVAKKALANLKKQFPGLSGWADSGPVAIHPRGVPQATRQTRPPRQTAAQHHPGGVIPQGWETWVAKINQKKPTFLFVALAMKKQEAFIWQNWSRLKVNLAMGVGGAFDYLSGEIQRAPASWQRLGLEWLYRLIRQPWRIKRQLALLAFIKLVLFEDQLLE